MLVAATSTRFADGQVTNQALRFDGGTGQAIIAAPRDFGGRDAFTLEFWTKIDSWDVGASLIEVRPPRGHGLRLELGSDASLLVGFAAGDANTHRFGDALRVGCWHHTTVVFDGAGDAGKQFTLYVDRKRVEPDAAQGALPRRVSPQRTPLVLGAGFREQLDELRLWGSALGEGQLFDYNTVSRSHPRYHDLLGHWKFDHPAGKTIYDFKGTQHGVLSGRASKSTVTDNQRFRYRSLQKYYPIVWIARGDRPSVEYLTNANELTVMLMHMGSRGETHFTHPDNDAEFDGADWASEYQGRKGVAIIQQEGSLSCGKYAWTNGDKKSLLSGWFCLDRWTEGASLFSIGPHLSLSLGDESTYQLRLQYKETVATSASRLKPGEWHYVTMVFDGSQPPENRLQVFLDAEQLPVLLDNAGGVGEALDFGPGHNLVIGRGLACVVDDLFVQSRMAVDAGNIRRVMRNGFTGVDAWSDWYVKMFLGFDDAEEPGRDHRKSSEDFRQHILQKVDGYDGIRLTLGLGTSGDWRPMVADPAARTRSVRCVRQALLDYPQFGGWISTWNGQ
ncbi:MAG: LamG-like jellyroll fold domain-containing protein [Planctomycetota bacterium]